MALSKKLFRISVSPRAFPLGKAAMKSPKAASDADDSFFSSYGFLSPHNFPVVFSIAFVIK